VASTLKVFSMGHINQLTWVPAPNIPSPLKWFLGLFSDFAASLFRPTDSVSSSQLEVSHDGYISLHCRAEERTHSGNKNRCRRYVELTGEHLNFSYRPTSLVEVCKQKKLPTAIRCSSRCKITHAAAAAAKFVYVRSSAGSVNAHTAAYG